MQFYASLGLVMMPICNLFCAVWWELEQRGLALKDTFRSRTIFHYFMRNVGQKAPQLDIKNRCMSQRMPSFVFAILVDAKPWKGNG